MVEKTAGLAADVIVLDLEDSVPPTEKGRARETARQQIPRLAAAGQTVHVRVNPIASGLTRYDLAAVVCPELAAVLLPKVEKAQDIRDFDVLIREQELSNGVKPGAIGLVPLIETALGVLNCWEICRASTRVVGLAFGAEDYTSDLGARRSREGRELDYARQVIVTCAAGAQTGARPGAGLIALDTPYADFRDEEGLVRETEWARSLGFRGKYLIHPSQIEPVNRIFRPTEEEVTQAQRVVAALEEALARGQAAVQVDGGMVDEPVAARARRLIDLAKAIEEREGRHPSGRV